MKPHQKIGTELAKMPDNGVLASYEAIRQHIEVAKANKDLPALKDTHSKLQAFGDYIKKQEYELRFQNDIATLRINTQCALVELARELYPHGGDRKSAVRKSSSPTGNLNNAGDGEEVDRVHTLEDEIPHQTFHRWSQVEAIPQKERDKFIKTLVEEGREVTSAAVVRLARPAKVKTGRRVRRVSEDRSPEELGAWVLDELFHLDITVTSITAFERALTKWQAEHVSEAAPEDDDTISFEGD